MSLKQKKIKFICPSKVSLSSKDDSITKLKPVLGQNQISLASFIGDFNKKSSILNSDLLVRTVILKNLDKTYDVSINFPEIELVLNTLKDSSTKKAISLSKYQDIIIAVEHFNSKINPGYMKKYSKLDRNKIYSKIILPSVKSLKYEITS